MDDSLNSVCSAVKDSTILIKMGSQVKVTSRPGMAKNDALIFPRQVLSKHSFNFKVVCCSVW